MPDEDAEILALRARFVWFRSRGIAPRSALLYARAEQFYDNNHWPYFHRSPEGEERGRQWLRLVWCPDPLCYGRQMVALCAWMFDHWETLDSIGDLVTQQSTDGARLIEADLLYHTSPTYVG